jgi:hypothetical protein
MLGHRLRLVQNVTAAGAEYGTGNFGDADGIYGERATDPANLLNYVTVPLAGGLGSTSVLELHVGDRFPVDLDFQIIAFGGPFEDQEGAILDLSTVSTAVLRATKQSVGTAADVELSMTIDAGTDVLTRAMTVTDFTIAGSYRAAIVCDFTSGRRMTVPASEQFAIKVTDT